MTGIEPDEVDRLAASLGRFALLLSAALLQRSGLRGAALECEALAAAEFPEDST